MRSFKFYVLFSLIFKLIFDIKAQNYYFKQYNIREGICHPFIYKIFQDDNGYIWLATGEGLCRFNGFDFIKSNLIDSIVPVDIVSSIYQDKNKNTYIGFRNGSVYLLTKNKFYNIFKSNQSSSVVGISKLENGDILVTTQSNGLFIINKDNKVIKKDTDVLKDKYIKSSYFQNDKLYISMLDGLLVFKYDQKNSNINYIGEIELLKNKSIQEIGYFKKLNSIISVTDEGEIIAIDNNSVNDLSSYKINIPKNLILNNIQTFYEDSKGRLLIGTSEGNVYRLEINDKSVVTKVEVFNKNNGLNISFVKTIFVDKENNLWIGSFGEGIFKLSNENIKIYNIPQNNNILAICVDKDFIWTGTESGLYKINKHDNSIIKIPGVDSKITDLKLVGNNLWIGTEGKGLFILVKENKIVPYLYPSSSGGKTINAILCNNKDLYLATRDGIYYINLTNNQFKHYTTYDGLPYNNIKNIYLDNSNSLLLATQADGLWEIDLTGNVRKKYDIGKYEIEFNSIIQDNKGEIWSTTYGNGVFNFKNDSFNIIDEKTGLKSNFCYSIIVDNYGYIWVGHRMAISRINPDNYSIEIFDIDKGITGDCNLNAVCKDENGVLYFGTTNGLVYIDPSYEPAQKIYPIVHISKIFINDLPYKIDENIVLPYSKYKIRIEFDGLYYKSPESVLFQYKLDGYDLNWSEITNQRYALYPAVTYGKFKFLVKAFLPSGGEEISLAEFNLIIRPPFYLTWWFISLSILFIISTFILIIKLRERRQKQIEEYLRRELEARTKEVIEQKEQLEIKNRDITDSILYAQRIQTSLLPPISKLQEYFEGAFVYYQPKDIVSGDFYWFDKISDNKFLIVCADSTGHGVPGAFMSLIGTTLLKDICYRKEVLSPSEILKILDKELTTSLNQNLPLNEKTQDGMDIIVCEIDLDTYYLRYASAMRPMIIYKDGEEIYVKGGKSSVGGFIESGTKSFENEGLQLSKGDLIYLFSDGYPDQFGGPLGKKFKMVRLRNLLAEIKSKSMDEQYEHIKNTFMMWKEGYPQVDDVLFMGIRL